MQLKLPVRFQGGAIRGEFFGVGLVDYHVKRYGADPVGSSSFFGIKYSVLTLSSRFHLFNLKLAPEVSYSPLNKTNSDHQKFKVLVVSIPFVFDHVSSVLNFKLGSALMWR